MVEKIRIVVADDTRETRQNIKTLLEFDERMEIVGEAENGDDAVFLAKEASPDIILMDVNMPVKDGIHATEEITLECPDVSIVMISVQNEHEYLRKAMAAGARDYISKPFSGDDLINTLIKAYETGYKRRQKVVVPSEKEQVSSKIISVFSTKGGTGKTTVAVNLAAAIARQTKKSVALVDFDLLFGNAAVQLNVSVKSNISELVKVINSLDEESVEDYLVPHFSGVRVLAAPTKPEYAEYITAQHIDKILKVLKNRYHYIIIDTGLNFNETTLAALDSSDTILYMSTMDLPSIKNTRTGIEVMENLKYSNSKVQIVINKASEQLGVKYSDFENTVRYKIWAKIPEDSATVINSMNKGFPFVMSRTKTPVADSIYEMVTKLTEVQQQNSVQKPLLKRILGFQM